MENKNSFSEVIIKLCNIDIGKLKNINVIGIAEDLGCPYDLPSPKMNKYLYVIAKKDKEGEEIDEDLRKLFDEERKKIEEEFDITFKEYMSNVINWLVDNGYAEGR